jgi:hypothetical protein
MPQRASARRWLTVIPTVDLQAWIAQEDADLARLLQGLGLRRRSTPPTRAWKVTIFEADVIDLCRPVADLEPGTPLASLTVCAKNERPVPGKYAGCGYTSDLATGKRGLDVFNIQWNAAAARGFCVLPAERFLKQR